MSDATLYLSVGGKMITHSPRGGEALSEPWWDFGWRPKDMCTDEQNELREQHDASIPHHAAPYRGDVKRTALTSLWKHPAVVKALGYAYSGTHQLTGSCVGAGGGNVACTNIFREIILGGDWELIILGFYLYTYGRSRFHSGFGGRGEGSTGTGWIKAALEDGFLGNHHEGLPKPKNTDGLIWGKAEELLWSDGGRAPCTEWLEEGRKRRFQSGSRARNADEVRDRLIAGYSSTCASMYGHNPRIEKGVLLGRKGPRWSHQMGILDWWDHPELGEIFWLHNQWGLRAHGICPSGMPPGGVWILKEDVEWICRTGEVYTPGAHVGYPAPDFDVPWIILAA